MKKSELIENSNRYRRLKKGLFGDPSGKIRTFAIISAENPLGWKDSTEEEFKQRFVQWFDDKKLYNKQSVEKIESSVLLHKIEDTGNTSLKYGGFAYVPLKGKYGDLEKSYIIFNLTLSDAKTIARDYGQESFFFANVSEDKSTIAYYQTFNGCKTYTFVDISETISDETEAEDYFSKFGFKFRINMKEFGDDVPEVIDKSAFEESFDEEIRNFSARALKRRQAYRRRDTNDDQLDEGYEDLISYMATGNKKKLSKKRKNQKKALSFFGNAGNPKYNADFFNHVMGSDGGEFGSVNGTDMVAGDMSLNIGGNTGGGDSAGGDTSSGGGMGESLSSNKHPHTVLESFELHKELNSLFFNVETGKMKEEVRHRLFKIAYLLIESMIENDIPLSISDILLIGSNAAYNYTEYSDLDLHILVDKSVVEDQALLTNLYNYIKADFNNKYDISIYGHDVEVYLQGLDEENAAAGVYSILKDEWVKFPEQPEEERSITIEDKEIFKNWENRYNNLLDHEIDTFVQDLYKLRKSSLKSEGEFSDGNLVFKEFRNRGYLKDLKDRKNKIKSNELTLECINTDKGGKLIIEGIEINPGINPQIVRERPDWFFSVDLVKSQLEKIDIPSDTTIVVKSLSEGFVVEIYKIRKSDGQEVKVWESHIIKAQQLSGYQLDLIKKYVGEKI